MNQKHYSCAFTLIEMVIVLVITGMVVGGIWAGTAMAIGNTKTKHLQEQVLTIVENIRQNVRSRGDLRDGQINYLTTSNGKLTYDFIFPADMIKTNGVVFDAHGDLINAARVGTGLGCVGVQPVIQISFVGANAYQKGANPVTLPKKSCISLLLNLSSTATQGYNVGLCGTSVGTPAAFNLATVKSACDTVQKQGLSLYFNVQ